LTSTRKRPFNGIFLNVNCPELLVTTEIFKSGIVTSAPGSVSLVIASKTLPSREIVSAERFENDRNKNIYRIIDFISVVLKKIMEKLNRNRNS
jgi:hypothetical protein